ncbi:ABC transporter permease [Marinilactibacillus psychrotolerans]|uniref:Multidrug ABC transporter permease protein n=1 Tax=Marinilactibacillus psychrotolerans TaxID=191770 RepID=A0AAV3WSS8_9LACT|nr:ABC transporter permease [Marinilactibacillus psychrotolerans]GEL67852.1 multidrug ABC transporter permease [Marinilactibacillus psychrotolerans]GEQ34524.1 multidrug ABC transporter permease protein [Marinilactibacillus psychrotolerans]SDC01448.1 ABC-2 type transport system permease protein [Marinilactibacillus psychrotolerans]
MTVISLFKQRTRIYQKQLSRYMKYVLNDHFVLAVLLLLGAGGFGYSNYVQTVSNGAILPRVILVIVMILVLSAGRITTLMQSADIVFLLPLEAEVKGILKKNIWKSFIFLAIPIAFASAAAMPLLVVTLKIEFNSWPIFLATALLLKFFDLKVQYITFLEKDHTRRLLMMSASKILSAVGLIFSIFVNLYSGLILVAFFGLVGTYYLKKIYSKDKSLQWTIVIEKEENRLQKIYRFINLFTEVTFLEQHPNRLKWLDKWIETQSRKNNDPHYYYIVRSFYRNQSYSGLVLRLTLIGILLILFSSGVIIKLILTILFLYLIGFQLTTIYQQFKQNFYFQLYPVPETGKIKSIQRLIGEILSIVAIFFIGANLTQEIYSSGIMLIGSLIFIYGFTSYYLPRRLSKIE